MFAKKLKDFLPLFDESWLSLQAKVKKFHSIAHGAVLISVIEDHQRPSSLVQTQAATSDSVLSFHGCIASINSLQVLVKKELASIY